jgi:heptosyltransferase-2
LSDAGEIGDLLVTTPTLRALKERYPRASISIIVRKYLAGLVEHNPHVDERVLYPGGCAWSKAAFLGKLLFRKWDLWVDLHTPTFNTFTTNEHVFSRNAQFMRAARTRFRLGFGVPELLPRLTHAVPIPPREALASENIAATTLRLAEAEPRSSLRKILNLAPDDVAWAETFWTQTKLHEREVVGLFFGSKQPAEVWPIENAAQLCRLLRDAFPQGRFLLFGGPHEAEPSRRLERDLAADCFPPVINVTGLATLGQTAALMKRCRAVVASNSGPMHIADAVGVPLVSLISGKVYVSVWCPTTPSSEVLHVPVSCSPCFLSVCPYDNDCLRRVRAEQVLEALKRVLEKNLPCPLAG